MSITTPDAFLALLEKSRLVSPGQLAVAQAVPGQDPQVIAQALIRAGQLTRWQAQQLLAGRQSFFLGKYKLFDKLGEGGMGAVYKAQQTTTGRMVAIKVMSENVVKQPGAVSRFHLEIRAVSALQHPNIVAAFDADQVGETHFLVMEYAEGRDLKEWIQEFGKLPIDWSCECIRQAALGLQHAHERGLAHRDIKPSNLLVVSSDVGGIPQVKILDMGLARFTSETQCTVLTQTGQVLGTIDYIAPEQAQDTRGAGIQADIFSLGASLFHMLTGQVPFLGKNPVEKLMVRAMRDAPRASTLSPAIPPALDEIIARMLARKPSDRFQLPAEVVAALAPFCLGATSDHRSSLTLPESAAADSTIEAEADQTLNRFLGTLESGPAADGDKPIRGSQPSGSNHPTGLPPMTGDEARLRPAIQRGPGFQRGRLPVKWIAAAAALLLVSIGAIWSLSGEKPRVAVPSGPPKPSAIAKASAVDLALLFDVRSNVQVPSLKMGHSDPLCVEAYVQIEKILKKNLTSGIAGFTGEFGLGHNNTSPVHVSATVYLDPSNARASHQEPIVLGQRRHLAGVRQGDEVRLYLDGKKVGSARFPVERQSNKDGFLEIGRSFQGIIDEVRVSKVARYDKDFTSAPRFENDPQTVALYHCDEGTGDVLKDSSGNNHHGKIVGAKWVKVDGSAITASDPDRRAAEWVLSIGSQICIKENGQEREIKAVGDLPHGAFELTVVDINTFNSKERDAKLTDAGLANFKDCKNLTRLALGGSQVTDAGLANCFRVTMATRDPFEVSPSALTLGRICNERAATGAE